ncbi:hydrogenase maturation protease [Thiohalorhabdus methylotrophus]|uniref:Hydrogenase maturation protease n=1 Tax=Thiohalorhabdus methylotrophus TaxID=3242694 RepID=A0ABV4TSV5_9GAMM
MTSVAVLGIGSPFGGDRLGWAVVEALRAGARDGWPEVRFRALDRPGAGLVAHLEGMDHAVLVDAVRTGAAPGTLHRITDRARLPVTDALSSHGFGLAEGLALAERLGQLPEWVVIGVEADPGSEPRQETVGRAVALVRAEVAARLAGF